MVIPPPTLSGWLPVGPDIVVSVLGVCAMISSPVDTSLDNVENRTSGLVAF